MQKKGMIKMLEWIRFGIVAFCFLMGTVFLCISLAGTFKFGYSLNRIHAAAMCDTLVLMFFITGCIVASGINIVSFKFFLVIAFQWCTSPLVSHMFVKAKIRTDDKLRLHCRLPECDETESISDNKEEQ